MLFRVGDEVVIIRQPWAGWPGTIVEVYPRRAAYAVKLPTDQVISPLYDQDLISREEANQYNLRWN